MRVISGEFKGRKLISPEDNQGVRPTSDKVKEAIFSIAMHNLYDGVCIDLFGGSGGLGIEAISRGAKKCYFCDSKRESMKVIKENVKLCKCLERATFLMLDYKSALNKISERADLIILDPPYESGYYEVSLDMIDSLDLLASDGIIIAEHNSRMELPEQVGRLLKTKFRKYGTIALSIYEMGEELND